MNDDVNNFVAFVEGYRHVALRNSSLIVTDEYSEQCKYTSHFYKLQIQLLLPDNQVLCLQYSRVHKVGQ